MSQAPGSPGSPVRPPVDPSGASAPPPPPYGAYPVYMPAPPAKRGGILTRILMGLFVSLFIFSLLTNFYLTQTVALLMGGPHEETYRKGDSDERIVIVPVQGVIDDSSAVFIRTALDVVRNNKDNLPKAIVLRVDSPGGYVGASDRIHHELAKFKKEFPTIPIVCSMGSIAASGGYYVSMPCDTIFAEPTCITGSIGVIMQGATIEELLKKIGVDPKVIVADTSPRKDIANNIFRAWTEEDVGKIKQILNAAHERFIEVVVDGRKAALDAAAVKALCNGDMFTAQQAKANKMVDDVGYLDDALAEAAKRSGAKADVRVTIIRPSRGFSFMNLLGQAQQQPAFPQNGHELGQWLREATAPTIEYRWSPGM